MTESFRDYSCLHTSPKSECGENPSLARFEIARIGLFPEGVLEISPAVVLVFKGMILEKG